MTCLTDTLGLARGEKAALIGCAGKTSLMYALAEENRASRVLIGTTTRIYRPKPGLCDYCVESPITVIAKSGVTLLHGGERNGKLTPADTQLLCAAHLNFDYTVLECDGSKGLPLKGWAAYEPDIPAFVTTTIGVCAVWPVGLRVSDKVVHRLPEFCAITGARSGDIVTESHIAAMISNHDGMMKRQRGKRALFINQIESDAALRQAGKILGLLPDAFMKTCFRVIAGSLRQNSFHTLWEG